jgi:hypothetical protein
MQFGSTQLLQTPAIRWVVFVHTEQDELLKQVTQLFWPFTQAALYAKVMNYSIKIIVMIVRLKLLGSKVKLYA